MAEPTSTRDMLLDAAARLFAERGIDNVSIAEIVRTAGQRNASAVHYHFGSRDEILRAVLARHVPAIAERRRELLEQARAAPPSDVRSAAEAIVRPVTEFAQRGWRERAYLQIGSELTGAIDRASPEIRELMTADGRARRRGRCSANAAPRCPPTCGGQRREICIVFIGRAAADRARLLDGGGEQRRPLRRPVRRQSRRHGDRGDDGAPPRRLTSWSPWGASTRFRPPRSSTHMFEALKNWGRWGADDQRGALNHLTDDRRAAAVGLVRTGESISLAHDLATEPLARAPPPGPAPHAGLGRRPRLQRHRRLRGGP